MIRTTKIFFAICVCSILLFFAAAVTLRFSYHGYTKLAQLEKAENLQEYLLEVEDAEEDDSVFSDVHNYEELENASDVIARVSVTDERDLFLLDVIKTQVEVKEVYKGDLKTDQIIWIYEPAGFSYNISKTYNTLNGYQLMKSRKEYYVFLQPLITADGYRKSAKEKNTFLPSTTNYSIIPVEKGEHTVLEQSKVDEKEYKYKQIQEQEILTTNKETMEVYLKIKSDFMRIGPLGEQNDFD